MHIACTYLSLGESSKNCIDRKGRYGRIALYDEMIMWLGAAKVEKGVLFLADDTGSID